MAKTPEQIQIEDDYISGCRHNDLPIVKDILAGDYFKGYKNKQFFLDEGLASSTHQGIDVMHYLLTSPDLPLHANIHENEDRPLRLAIKRGTFEQVEFLCCSPLLKEHANINGTWESCNAFLNACEEGTLECVQFLLTSPKLKEPANLHYHDKYGYNGLFEACRKGRLDIVRYLLTSPDLPQKLDIHTQQDACLGWACCNGHVDVMDFLCFSPEIDEHIDLGQHQERLVLSAVSHERLEVLKFLKEKATSPLELNYTSYSGSTIFEEACGRRNPDLINFLLYEMNYHVTTEEKITTADYNPSNQTNYVEMVEKRDLYLKMNHEIAHKTGKPKLNKI